MENTPIRNLTGLVVAAVSLAVIGLYLIQPVWIKQPGPLDEDPNLSIRATKDLLHPKSKDEETFMPQRSTLPSETRVAPDKIEGPLIQREEPIQPSEDPERVFPAKDPETIQMSVNCRVEGYIFDLATGGVLTQRAFSVKAYASDPGLNPTAAEVDLDSGAFWFLDLPMGHYHLLAMAEGYVPFYGDLTVPLRGRIMLGLEEAGSVRIRITDQYAQALTEIQVQDPSLIFPGVPNPLSHHIEEGYHRVQGLRMGNTSLILHAPGFESLELKVLVVPQKTLTYWAIFK